MGVTNNDVIHYGIWHNDIRQSTITTKEDMMRDQTRGSGPIDPVTYKKDAIVQLWMDSRHLATLCEWLEGANGIKCEGVSMVIQMAMQLVCENLHAQGYDRVFERTVDARQYLKIRFPKKNFNICDRGKKNLTHNLTLDTYKDGKKVDPHKKMHDDMLQRYRELETLGDNATDEQKHDAKVLYDMLVEMGVDIGQDISDSEKLAIMNETPLPEGVAATAIDEDDLAQ
jgi:hypothetical protein